MIKVKDGYAKLVGTTYLGSVNHLLRSNGDIWEVHTGRNNEANKIVRTDGSGHLQTGWINTTSGDMGTTSISRIYCSNDSYIRYKTPANFFSSLTNDGDNLSITIASQNRTLTVYYARIAGQLRSKGTIAPQTGRTQSLGDVYSYHLNASVSGGPTTYASVIGFGRGTSGTVEIAGEWTGGRGLWVRALRDTTDNWYAWDKVLTQATYTGITDSRYYTKTQADERFVNVTGDTMSGELINTSTNAYRLRGTSYGVILRNDNSSFWILTTDSGSPSGSYNSLRPFRINLSDGRVTLGNGLSVTGTIVGSSTIQGTRLISTVANGTAPLTVTSKTLVTNLNSQFLNGYTSTDFLRLQKIANSTNVHTLTETLLYWTDTDGNSGTLTNSAFTGSHAMIQVKNYISDTDYRRSRIAFDGYGVLKTFNDRSTSGNGGVWYTVLTSANYSSIIDASKYFTALTSNASTNLTMTIGGTTKSIVNLYARYLANAYTSRQASMNVSFGDGTLRTFKATSTTTTGKPMGDAHIIHLAWDNTGGYDGQIALPTNYRQSMQWRVQSAGSYNNWKTIVDSANYTGIVLKIGTATKGSATLPIYLNAGTPTACSTTLGVSITGNAATATKLQTARTINGTSFDGSANITTAYWGATRTITLSGAITGSASVNGSQNVTITTTYQTGSIDGRYVGGKKTAGHGSQGTAYTADTYSSNFVNKAFVAYAERGSWAYANNGYVTTDTGVNIPLAGTAIFQWGASDTNKTQLFITPHNNSGVSNPAANEMLFYTSNGSGYTSAWTRVLTHRNYTTYTVTKTGGGASGTWGISITGTAAAARKLYKIDGTSRTWTTADSVVGNGLVSYTDTSTSGRWDSYGSIFQFSNADNPTPGTNGHWLTQIWSGTSNKLGVRWRTNTGSWSTMQTILTNTNYVSYADTRYVTALGTNGNYVTWTKNGTTNNLTVPFATTSNVLNNLGNRTAISGTTLGESGLRLYRVYNNGYPVTYGNVLNVGGSGYGELLLQWTGDSSPGHLYYRSKRDVASQAWSNWVTILDNNNYSSTLDGRYVTLTTNQTVSGIKTFSTQQKFTVATGTSPFTVSSTTVVSNLNSDMLDGWHLSYILKDGYVTSGTSGLSSYWRKIWDITLNNQYNDVDINLLVHSAYNQQWGIISFRLRQNGTGTSKSITAYLAEVVGNIPLDRFRLYYNNSSGLCQLWCNTTGQYNVYNYRVLAKTWRTATESSTLGTFYSGNTTTAQALPSDSYVSMTGITIVNTASKVANALTFSAGKFSTKTYNGSAAVTVNIPTNTSHLTNDSGFWTGTRYWANIAVSTSSSSTTSPTFSNVYLGSHLYLNNKGSNSIYNGPNDATNGVGGALNNLVFSSWFGVSFTTSCSGQTYTNKNAVSINCRTGLLSANTLSGNRAYIGGYNNTSYALSTSSFICNSWVRSVGSTGWYNETYGGGWYMSDSTWIRTYGSKSVYQNTGQIRTDGYLVTNGGITVGATSPNNGTYKSHVTGNSWSSGYIRAGAGFYHNSVNSNSYVLLAGGSYKSLADFAKGNAGASNRGVYVTNGTVTAMTYYLNATVNSGASGKLAYYSGTNSIDDYTNTIGSSSTPIYINNGIPNAANSYKVVNSDHYFSAFGISGYIYVIRYGQVVCVSINMSSGGNGSTGTTTLLTNLPSAVYTTGQSASKGGGSALRQATFYVSGTTLYVYSYQANQLPDKVSFTYITNTLE